jgi:hypothetical protein
MQNPAETKNNLNQSLALGRMARPGRRDEIYRNGHDVGTD